MNIQSDKRLRLSIIELLNDEGFSLIYIDDSFYSFTEFIPADSESKYITLVGKNITSLIESSTQLSGWNQGQINHFRQMIEDLPSRRREFHANQQWIKYVRK